jgi:hypothetical protein
MEVMVIAMLAFMPATFGAVEAWSQLIVLLGAASLSILLVLRWALDPDFRPVATWTYVPLASFIGLVALQLVPLPIGLSGGLSPATVSIRQEMLGGDFESTRAIELSMHPYATAQTLRMVLVGTVMFVTVVNVFRAPRQITSLLTAIFVIGCAEALLAIAQVATGTKLTYWFFPTSTTAITSGSFVNYSHFCQFTNLSLGAGIALLLVRLHERRDPNHGGWLRPFSRVNWETHGWILAGLALCAVSVFTSMSRGGVVSLVVATGIVAIALGRRNSSNRQAWLIGAVPLGVFMILLMFGLDRLFDRFAALHQSEIYASRGELVIDTLRVWQAFPIFGAGLGTHEFIFPMFDRSVLPALAAHADNEYAQLLEETGVVGAMLVAAFLIGMALTAVRLAFRGRTAISAAAFGVAFGLLAVAIHSVTDFGQRIPAIFCITATLCGVLVSIDCIESQRRRSDHGKTREIVRKSPWMRRGIAGATFLVVLIVWGWALRSAYSAHLGERWWTAAYTLADQIQQDREQGTDEEYIDLLAAAEQAFASDPDNVAYGYWLAYYRWEALSRTIDSNFQQTVLDKEALAHVSRIADELAAVRVKCPTYGPPYALEGQLRLNVLGDEYGAELIRKGFRLAPHDPPTCLVAGELAASEGHVAEAQRLLTRAVRLQPSFYSDVINVYLFDLKRPDLARELAGDDYARLESLAAACAASETYAKLAEDLQADFEASLRRRVESNDATAQELASLAEIEVRQKEFDSAISLYRRALAKAYRQVPWRIQLAQALAETGQVSEGIDELRICLRLQQNNRIARKLLEEFELRAPQRHTIQ